jgi:N-carbamoylputrescine amidase
MRSFRHALPVRDIRQPEVAQHTQTGRQALTESIIIRITIMKVTVCQMSDDPNEFARDWDRLVQHVKRECSDLVLLPEMPFHPWFAVTRPFSSSVWAAVVAAHEAWLARLEELEPAIVLGSRPVELSGRRVNQGFVWDRDNEFRAAHTKYYLPDEEGFWEASWYERGDGQFIPIQGREARIGFQICTDLWFFDRARAYGKQGVHLIANPRATPKSSVDKWLAGGRAAAVVSGAFCLSSNRVSGEGQPVTFGGLGWIIGPDGDVLGLTSPERPFVTLELDLTEAERAKSTYPRYVPD